MSQFFDCFGASAQFWLYLGLLLALWLGETVASEEKFTKKWMHSRLNFSLIFLTLPVQLAMTALVVAVSQWVKLHHWGLLFLLPGPPSHWTHYILAFVLLDFLDYIYHVTMHKLGCLWRFHLVHHSDQIVDVSTTLREHPGETAVRMCFLTLWVFLLGAGWPILLLRQTVETISNLTSHSKYRLPARLDRILGWVFITPNLHHVHHHHVRPYTDCNYGDVFSVWDRMFGTFARLSAAETVFGIDSHPAPQITTNFPAVVLIPFRKAFPVSSRPRPL